MKQTENPLSAMNPQELWGSMSEQWLNAYKTSMDMLLAVANAGLASTEQLRMSQLAAEKETQEAQKDAASALSEAQDVQGVMKAQQALANAYLVGMQKHWKSMAQMAQETQAEVQKIWTEHFGTDLKSMMPALKPGAIPQMDAFTNLFETMRTQQETMMKAFGNFANIGQASKGGGKGSGSN